MIIVCKFPFEKGIYFEKHVQLVTQAITQMTHFTNAKQIDQSNVFITAKCN